MDATALALIVSAATSLILAEVLVLSAHRHGRVAMDFPGAVQTFHTRPTPRIGGVAVYLALLLPLAIVPDPGVTRIIGTIVIAALPALLAGLLEDLTGRVRVSVRLGATLCSGALACWISGITLTQLHVPALDSLLAIGPVAVIFTAFAIGGVSNAFNIIDGFHGLASGTATLCVMALACISVLAGDPVLAVSALLVVAAIAGFWFVNFPWGRLFLGDGGAYFVGLSVAWIAVLLPVRNPSVSPWASLLVCAYPIIEVMYSMLRRRAGGAATGVADRGHLHSLIAMRLMQRLQPGLDPALQNSAVSVLMWVCAAFPALVAVTLYAHTGLLMVGAVASLLLYHCLYRWVART